MPALAKIPVVDVILSMGFWCKQIMTQLISCNDFFGRLRSSRLLLLALTGFLSALACSRASQTSVSQAEANQWHAFEGTWTAAGNRQIMRLGNERQASIANLEGSLLLEGSSRPTLGFRAQAVVLNDSATGMIGRAVWTDEHGDQAYSELRGEGTATNNKIVGTFLGGTGRYAGAEGAYEFSWRFVLENEDGTVQGQSRGLRGRVRVGSEQSVIPRTEGSGS
jgi:hypothetical protein